MTKLQIYINKKKKKKNNYTVQEISKETNVPKSHVSTILKNNL